jgi:hypothetical protein
MTNGQRQMSVTFNPGQREDVEEIKQKCADAYDAMEKHFIAKYPKGAASVQLHDTEGAENWLLAIDALKTAQNYLHTAQMKAVYAVTR